MNVGMTTATATNQGLIAGRLTRLVETAAVLTMRAFPIYGLGSTGPVGRDANGCSTSPACGPVAGFL